MEVPQNPSKPYEDLSRNEWIEIYGSERLRRALRLEAPTEELYKIERLEYELPGWYTDWQAFRDFLMKNYWGKHMTDTLRPPEMRSPKLPSEDDLDLLEKAQVNFGCRLEDIRLREYKVTFEPNLFGIVKTRYATFIEGTVTWKNHRSFEVYFIDV